MYLKIFQNKFIINRCIEKIKKMKLNHYLAQAGIASRRKAADLVKTGNVTVNGNVVKNPGYEVKDDDAVAVNGKSVRIEKKLYILLNKPVGFITTVVDEKGRPTVLNLIPNRIKGRIYPVGRLDRNTTGLLLLTNDGDLAHTLAHPRHRLQKTYYVILNKPVHHSVIERIKKGIRLPDGIVHVDRISYVANRPKNHIKLILHSGKYRIVRRLLRYLGFTVVALDRVSYVGLTKKGLKRGKWRFLKKEEINMLKIQ